MKKRVRDISFKVKSTFLFCALLLSLIATFGSCLYVHYHKVFRQSYRESFQMATTANAKGIEETFSEMKNGINVLHDNDNSYIISTSANLSMMADLIINTRPDERGFDFSDMLYQENLCLRMMKAIFYSTSNYALFIEDDFPISTYFRSQYKYRSGIYSNKNVKYSEWYQNAIALTGKTYWFTDPDYENCLFMAKQLTYQSYLLNEEYMIKPLGVIVLGMEYKKLNEKIDISKMPENTQVLILDESGTLLYCNHENEMTIPKEALAEVVQNADGGADFFVYDETQYLLQKNKVADGLFMLTIIPSEAITKLSSNMLNTLLVMMSITLLVGIVLISILSNSMVAPIVNLAGQMKKGIIEQIDTQEYGEDEIGILYRGYNQLQESMSGLLSDAWESAQKQKDAEMKMLQAQINPHFVYNTLGMISCEALLKGENEIAEQINILTQIMRYSTREPGALTPLEKEIEIICQYLQIQKVNGKRIELSLSVADNCKDILIPKLMIQPLVENSIIHGIAPDQKDGRISIQVQRSNENRMTIQVNDNGRGCDIEEMNRRIREDEGDGLGIKNVCHRIHHVYGDECRLEYRINENGETEAKIEVQIN